MWCFPAPRDDTKDSTYISGVVGAAYRPETSDRLNALVKYQYLYDNPGAGQVTVDGTTSSPAQISHIFSADATYALNEKFSIGAKYAVRIGEIRDRTLGADWTESQAHLGHCPARLSHGERVGCDGRGPGAVVTHHWHNRLWLCGGDLPRS